jgi:phage gp29-like protein
MGFADIFGMPMRVGRSGPGASKDDIATLMSAVANLGSDAAAVIPDSMKIDFLQATSATGAGDFFKGLAERWDKQVSKTVVGQTMSTDDGSTQAQANIHNEVRLDLLQADAKAESNTLHRYFVRPWCDLNFAPGRKYPRLILDVPQPENTQLLVAALEKLVSLGLEVEQSVIRDKLSIPEPAKGAKLLGVAVPASAATALNSEQARRPLALKDVVDNQVETLESEVSAAMDDMVESIRTLLDSVNSMEALRVRLIETYPEMNADQLADVMADGMAATCMAGRYDVMRGL